MRNDNYIDIERLRADLQEESLGAFFGGGFGGAAVEASDINAASDEELIQIARNKGVNLDEYSV